MKERVELWAVYLVVHYAWKEKWTKVQIYSSLWVVLNYLGRWFKEMERNDWKIEDGKSGNEVCGYIYIYFWRQKIWGYLSPKWRLTKGWPQLRRTLVNKWQRWPVSGGQAATFPATPGIPQWFNNQSKYARRIEVAHELSIMNFIHQWLSGYGYFNATCLPAISSSDQHHVPIVDSFLGMINQASDGRLIILNHFCHKKTGFFFFSEVDIYSLVKAMVFPVVMYGYES